MQFSLFTKTVCGFFAALFLFYVATMTLAPVRPSDFEWGVSTLGLPIFELTFFCLITLTIWKLRSTWLRYPVGIVCFLIPALIGTFYAIQMISVILTGKYITVLALENTSEISYVVNKTSVSITVGLLCLCLALAWAAFSGVRRRGPNKAVGISMTIGVILILALGAVYSERKNIISTAVESRFAPAIGLVETYQLKQASPPSNLARIVKFVLRVENGDTIPLYEVDVTADFPYQHDGSSHGELPFTIDRNSGEPMNIIIILRIEIN